ncbi:MAG TPA: hypothetical protein VMW15_01965 [Terracidiphilus sp.]|nr:hypothetical protein [Terracidiphilus sp.]
MQKIGGRREHPELKTLVAEASQALANLDADRLEELALSRQALNRDLTPQSRDTQEGLARQSREAAQDMAVLARVLEATRANLNVMNRLRDLRVDQFEYSRQQTHQSLGTESVDGDN